MTELPATEDNPAIASGRRSALPAPEDESDPSVHVNGTVGGPSGSEEGESDATWVGGAPARADGRLNEARIEALVARRRRLTSHQVHIENRLEQLEAEREAEARWRKAKEAETQSWRRRLEEAARRTRELRKLLADQTRALRSVECETDASRAVVADLRSGIDRVQRTQGGGATDEGRELTARIETLRHRLQEEQGRAEEVAQRLDRTRQACLEARRKGMDLAAAINADTSPP